MGDGDGLETGQSGFQDATDIVTFCFVTIGIAEMRFDPRNPITKSADCALHAGLNKSDDLLAPMDMVIRMDLNRIRVLHHMKLMSMDPVCQGQKKSIEAGLRIASHCQWIWLGLHGARGGIESRALFCNRRGRVSEILTKKRTLSLEMIRRLQCTMHIPLESLIGTAAGIAFERHTPHQRRLAMAEAPY